MKIAVTGVAGLLGRHAALRLHARNCAARFRGDAAPFELVLLDRPAFADPGSLQAALSAVDAVLHFAGVNRGDPDRVEAANPEIAGALIAACRAAGVQPHIVYANSTHADTDTPYGRSKRRAGELLAAFTPRFTDLVLPHIFGEGARPDYNNVTATFIDRVIRGERPGVNSDGRVELCHAGDAAEQAIVAATGGHGGRIAPAGQPMSVVELLDRIAALHESYVADTFPDLSAPFDLALFNSYRAALFPQAYPRLLKLSSDVRGSLFEAARGGGGGQTFLSWTHPGVTRGNHFHLAKVERFLVLEGDAIIRIRRVLDGRIHEFRVSGATPAAIDMPTGHTHSIENIGDRPLLTLFWTHECFDPAAPDTFADPVIGT